MLTIIFDLDGTLVDSSVDLMIAGNATFEQLGWKVRLSEDFSDGVVIGGGRSMLRYGFMSERIDFTDEDVNRLYPKLIANYDKTIDDNTFAYEGVEEALKNLKNRGWKIGLCTNKPKRQADVLLTKLGMRSFFESIVGAGTVATVKPHSEPLIAAVEALNGTIERTVLVGDTKTDRDTAIAAGAKCILVNYGHGALVYDLNELNPEALVDSAIEIPEAVEELFKGE